MLDPDVPKLQEARARLEVMVEQGEVTPAEASSVLGKMADGLLVARVNDTRRLEKNRLFGARYGREATLQEIAQEG